MDTPEYAAVPGEVVWPEVSVPSPTAIDPFAPVKNLHDLTRFLAIGDGAAASSAATAALAMERRRRQQEAPLLERYTPWC